ncbi:hypothetical protein NXF25_002515 [Crotalus adamanteus]|uniref:Uncharacterized protein n=1 Tax=Crotalus adamanteus TaxID=8729 RepID=A0AAW1CAK1_CROAD
MRKRRMKRKNILMSSAIKI